mmetsp:Transcript_2284/g.4551  ORF Transcript_2284/g.4551 Transcript_2284/m.4551 type:complete len:391 (-) Transcript_2284:145-1317(-)
MMRKLMLSSIFFGSLSCAACEGGAHDGLRSWPEADHLEADSLEMLQLRSKKLEFEADAESQDYQSCVGLFIPPSDSASLLQLSSKSPTEAQRLPPARNTKSEEDALEVLQVANEAEALRLPRGSSSKTKETAFNKIYTSGLWARGSGSNGSTVVATTSTRQILTAVLGHIAQDKLYAKQKPEIRMLDAACGDMQWMPLTWKESEIIRFNTVLDYHGVDISSEVLARDEALLQDGDLYSRHGISEEDVKARFSQMDLSADQLNEQYDLIVMKDVLGYLHNDDIIKILANAKKSGSKYLMITTDPTVRNRELDPDRFYAGRPVNVLRTPYNLDGLMCMDFQASDDSPARLALFDLQAEHSVPSGAEEVSNVDMKEVANVETQDMSNADTQGA